jgi:hypothetical protein
MSDDTAKRSPVRLLALVAAALGLVVVAALAVALVQGRLPAGVEAEAG